MTLMGLANMDRGQSVTHTLYICAYKPNGSAYRQNLVGTLAPLPTPIISQAPKTHEIVFLKIQFAFQK